jgi:hypothetical protein
MNAQQFLDRMAATANMLDLDARMNPILKDVSVSACRVLM